TLLICLVVFFSCALSLRAQEPSPSASVVQADTSGIPEGYELGEESVSPDGRFALLYPVVDSETGVQSGLPNVLARLKPHAVLRQIWEESVPRGRRNEPRALWENNSVVAIWIAAKWGSSDLWIYEIENDKVKRVHSVFAEARKYFDRDFKSRFLKKYPKESDGFTFVSDGNDERGVREIEFKGRQVLLNLFADNKPNLAGGPHWTAELHAVWNLDTAKFEKVDFKPGEISNRPWLEN
ncbi:MAG: hypothetical protein WAO00_19140, partial [Chthoniobacterales bacterium]